MNRCFSNETVSKYMKKCSTSLVIQEVQIKTMLKRKIKSNFELKKKLLRFHHTSERMTAIKKWTNNKCSRSCKENGTLLHCWWDCRLVQPLWKSMWRFLKKAKLEVPLDLAISLGIFPKEMHHTTAIYEHPCLWWHSLW